MDGVAASLVLIAVLLGVLLLVAFDVFCLVRLSVAGPAGLLPKLAWAVAIVCISPLGGIASLLALRRPRLFG
jgi:hypothetical protein